VWFPQCVAAECITHTHAHTHTHTHTHTHSKLLALRVLPMKKTSMCTIALTDVELPQLAFLISLCPTQIAKNANSALGLMSNADFPDWLSWCHLFLTQIAKNTNSALGNQRLTKMIAQDGKSNNVRVCYAGGCG